jgi:peroxiredoxin/predicted 2-oxoglutarate/Fe(II)-dependent dioxygenase YbiX
MTGTATFEAPANSMAVGDRAQNFVLPDSRGKFVMFYERTRGRPVILLFTPGRAQADAAATIEAFIRQGREFEDRNLDIFCVSLDSPADNDGLSAPFLIWSDPERAITAAYLKQIGVPVPLQGPPPDLVTAFLLDANQRVLALRIGSGADLVSWALTFYDSQPTPAAARVRAAGAPVLIMPNLLDRTMCRALIELWREKGHEEGTVGSVLQGAETDRVYAQVKRRLDHRITDPVVNRALQQPIGRRIAPEVHKAFSFEGFRFDRFLVVCYDAARGDRFRPHRDNLSPGTAERRFALTLNLNSEEYEGGELVFPEYGPDLYRPESGGAVIFSCSLIHEALPVRQGRRFALLTFLRDLPAPSSTATT